MIIYLITNTVNGKQYVGQTQRDNADKRFTEHVAASRATQGARGHFHKALRKYGAAAFVLEEIDSAVSFDELSEKERYWIAKYRTFETGYNMTLGGEGGSYPHSEEQKERQRQETLSRPPEFWARQKVATQEAMNNPEMRQKISCGVRKYYETHSSPWLGRVHTDETRQRMREGAATRDNTNLGKWERTEKHRQASSERIQEQRQREGYRNPMCDAESRSKVGASKIGRKMHHGPNGERKFYIPGTAPIGYTR